MKWILLNCIHTLKICCMWEEACSLIQVAAFKDYFFNDSTNVTSYINYCNSTFEYDKLRDRWIMPDGYLTLFIPNDDFEKRFAFVQTLV
jgi:hypothetical protein